MKNLRKLAVLALSTASLASCGAAKTTGIYQSQHIANMTEGDNVSELYHLEVFEDKTYTLEYNYTFAVSGMGINYGRNVRSAGKYTVKAEDAEAGTKTFSLEMPTSIVMTATHRNGTKVVIDSNNWNTKDEDGDGKADPIEYVLMERAETETWESAADFIASYGRTYEMEVSDAGAITKTTITNFGGKQIEQTNAVKNVNAA